MSVLFVGPLPEPVTGHSLACQVFVDELVKHQRVEVINLSKSDFKQGVSSLGRVFEVLRIVSRVWRKRKACDVTYFTISESIAGNLKDLMIYLACFRRLPCMAIHLHGGAGMREIMSARRPLLRNLNAFFLKRLGAVIVLGQRHVDIFSAAVDRSRIHVVPNFAQDHLFSDVAAIDTKFRQVRPLRVLFLSNLLPGKGHLELLEAFESLDAAQREACVLDFAGGFESDADKQEFLARIAALPQVRYHGTVQGEVKKRLFAEAHVFCLPTYYAYEGQPISILEAYASGCAVITTDHSGIFDIFSDGVNGYGVAKRSSAALKAALERALEMPDSLRAMAQLNFRTAQERYRIPMYTRNLIAVIDGLHSRATHVY